jgi:hypothetical protein
LPCILLAAAAQWIGCSGPPSPPVQQTGPPAGGPRQTLLRLVELRDQHKYREMPALIVPHRGKPVVDFLMAVDDFLASNRRLCNWLRDRVGVGLSQIIDQSYVVDDLGVYAGEDLAVFSKHVDLLDDAIHDDLATVSYTVESRLPARWARLRKLDGSWRYDPGPQLSEHLPAAFRELARGLDLVLTELEGGRIPAEEVSANPDLLVEKVKARLRRGVNLLSKARAAVQPRADE